MIQLIAFYLFAAITIASAAMVIFARNPVHSVMWLILAFFNAAGLMLLAGAEFIAMLLVIVYVGAVAVLFLFVVMMLDIEVAAMRAGPLVSLAASSMSRRSSSSIRRISSGIGCEDARRRRSSISPAARTRALPSGVIASRSR